MSQFKKEKGSKKGLVLIFIVFLTVLTFVWHEVRVSKRTSSMQSKMLRD